MARGETLKILNTEPEGYSRKAFEMLSKHFFVDEKETDRRELLSNIDKYNAIIVRLKNKIDKEVIDKATNLKYILSATTGTDHIDVSYTEKKNIEIICLKGEIDFLDSIPSTAEHTWGLLLSLVRNIPSAYEDVKKYNWNRDNFKGYNLKNKKIGLLGLGRVGKQVAKYALAFDMKVSAYDPYQTNWISYVEKFESPEELFASNEIISIHIPYNPSTENFVNNHLLKKIKRNSYLINTSRGGVWDENCVTELLKNKYLAGVATDVLKDEQDEKKIQKSLLLQYATEYNNLIITPHIAGATYESMEQTEEFIAKKFITHLYD